MRMSRWFVLPLLGAIMALPIPASSQSNVSVRFGTRLGPEVGLYEYSPERMGEWRTNYRNWTPVTLYDVNGHYYRNNVRGARAVLVYSYRGEYFLPPQDRAWSNFDRRYNYQRRPNDNDYGRGRGYTPGAAAVNPRLGAEIGVLGYSSDRAGEWRSNYQRWTPVTLYESNGKYYPNSVPGTRAVAMYRWQSEYFLPPQDEAWMGVDRRFTSLNQANAEDRARVRIRP